MIVKNVNVRASRVAQGKASSSLKSHFKYIQYRARDLLKESLQDRKLFDKEHDQVDRRQAHGQIMGERSGDIYYHRMILSPAQNEPVDDWRAWTRAVLGDIERKMGTDLDWYAVHHANTEHPHVHVVIRGTGIDHETGASTPVEFTPQDFRYLRERGREHSLYEHYHRIEETLRDLDRSDRLPQEIPLHEPEHTAMHTMER